MKSDKPVKTAETQPAFMSVKETTRIISRSKKSKEEESPIKFHMSVYQQRSGRASPIINKTLKNDDLVGVVRRPFKVPAMDLEKIFQTPPNETN